MRRIGAIAAVAFLLTACGTNDADLDAADTTTTSSESTSTTTATSAPAEELDADTPIGADGIGPLKAGMTLAEVRDAAGAELILEGFEAFEGYCWFADVKGLEEDFSLLFLAPERTTPVGEPDGAGKVTAIHGGLEDAAQLIEGCA